MRPPTAIAACILTGTVLAGCGAAAQIPDASEYGQPSAPAQADPADTGGIVSYTSSCTLVPSNSSWGPSWAGTDMPEVEIVNTGDVALSIAYLSADYTNAAGVIVGTDNPAWSPTVLDIPAGSTAEVSPTDAGWTPPDGAVACSLDTAASGVQAVSP